MSKKKSDYLETKEDDLMEESSNSEEVEKVNDVSEITDNGDSKKEEVETSVMNDAHIETKTTEAKKEDSWNFNDDGEGTQKSGFGWKLVSAILLILLVASVYSNGFNFTGAATVNTAGDLTIKQAEDKAIKYINDNLLTPPFTAIVKSSQELNGLYLITIDVADQEVDSYITKDGKLFFPQGFDLTIDPSTITGTTETKVDVSIVGDPVKGDSNAAVTIVEFSEFQCPYCGKYVDEAYKNIMDDYVKTGKVKYVFRDFPLGFHAEAKPAAMAAECAHEQNKFWEYHDKLFANQDVLGTENYKKWASDLGLDTTQFNACLSSEKYKSEVEEDFSEGQTYGVTGTPAFFINGKLISGAQPYSVFKTEIEAALKEASSGTTDTTTTGTDTTSTTTTTGTDTSGTTTGTQEVNMAVKKWRFDPNIITANKGDKVKLVITSDEMDINFVIPDLYVNKQILKGKTETIEFTVSSSGTFEFGCGTYCINKYGEVQGSALKGTLVVS